MTICIKQRSIKSRSMHVEGFHKDLHQTRINNTKSLSMHKHTFASNCVHGKEITIQKYE